MTGISGLEDYPFITAVLIDPNIIFVHLKSTACPVSERNSGIPEASMVLDISMRCLASVGRRGFHGSTLERRQRTVPSLREHALEAKEVDQPRNGDGDLKEHDEEAEGVEQPQCGDGDADHEGSSELGTISTDEEWNTGEPPAKRPAAAPSSRASATLSEAQRTIAAVMGTDIALQVTVSVLRNGWGRRATK